MFDLDGVLIDSEPVIQAAYRDAGVVPPDNVLGQEGTGWLQRQVGIHDMHHVREVKNKRYIELLRDVRLLSGYATACRLSKTYLQDVGVATAAPFGTLAALRERLNDWPFLIEMEGISTPERCEAFKRLWHGERIYVDDQTRLWRSVPGWRFIHYQRQTPQALCDMILENK